MDQISYLRPKFVFSFCNSSQTNCYINNMLEEGTKLLMANGQNKDVGKLDVGEMVMCEDGSCAKVTSIDRDVQTTYQILQKTKHRVNEGEAAEIDPLRRQIYHRLGFRCTVAHQLGLRTSMKPSVENCFKRNHFKVCWKNLEDFLTLDGRIIKIPRTHHKDFPMTPEGQLAAKSFLDEKESNIGRFVEYEIQVRDLDILEAQVRVNSFLRFNPLLEGNGILSEFLTGRKDLNSPAVLTMAWLLGLWIGDGTTKEPEISVDSHDISLMEGLIERGKIWGLYPEYKDEQIPLRAKHVKLFYGSECDGHRRNRHLRKNNPFWNCVVNLKFKRELDGEKQIPLFMWTENLKVREAFLAGLIDSDGYVSKRKNPLDSFKVSIQTVYPSIMGGIVHITRSLGMPVTVTTRSAKTTTIIGRKVSCHFTYDCHLAGRTPLQKVLSYCRSGHKRKTEPDYVDRTPIYFGFNEEKRGSNNVVGITVNSDKRILLDNKIVVHACGDHCKEEQPRLTTTRCLKYCIACPRKGVRYFYRDWSGRHLICGRCYGRYKFSGYRCLHCQYVPESREIKKAKLRGEELGTLSDGATVSGLICGRCNGILKFDEVRGPRKVPTTMDISTNISISNISSDISVTV